MKIAIIGAGIFGCSIASRLSKEDKVKSVVLYEKSSNILQGAAKNNQHRLHLGYHYPRSKETIEQIRSTLPLFLQEYGSCVRTIDKNYYLVANESDTSSDEYKKIFPELVEVDKSLLQSDIKVDKISAAFLTKEGCIDITELHKRLVEGLNSDKILVKTNTTFDEDSFDVVINTSYSDCTLFTDKLDVKYELCCLPLITNPFSIKQSITIVDGQYSSIYETERQDIYTLSNVKTTPFYKTTNKNDFIKAFNSSDFDYENIVKNICEETKKFFKHDNYNVVGKYISPKVKIRDDAGDVRTTKIIKDGKYITVLQGKISTVSDCGKQIVEYVLGEL